MVGETAENTMLLELAFADAAESAIGEAALNANTLGGMRVTDHAL